MLQMIVKGLTVEICHGENRYAKANNKYMKNYNKTKKKRITTFNVLGWKLYGLDEKSVKS